MKRYFIFLLVAFSILGFYACNDEPCQEQYCLNGGDCVDGVCICPSGWTGEHCDEAVPSNTYDCINGNCQTTIGGAYNSLTVCQNACSNSGGNDSYNCSNGNCIAVNGGTYSTLTVCQSACSSSGGNNSYNCSNGNCIAVNGGAYSTLAACQNACSNNNMTVLEYFNRTYTDINITINGTTTTIPPNQYASFNGQAGASAQGSASTSGMTSQGNTVGLAISWSINRSFPNVGTEAINLDIDNEYFFLYIRNQGSTNLNDLYVNYGLNSQTLDNIIIPNDGTTYRIGYYKAWSNSNVRAYRPNGTSFVFWDQGTHFNLPFNDNQKVTLNAN